MSTPRVSIAMGVYRPRRDYLLDSVESIIAQTFEDWELIICNDGSADNVTEDLLDEVASLDSRVKIVGYPQNKGLAFALNACIENARGEYIARQDDDDRSVPMRLQEQVRYLDGHPGCSFVGSEASVFDAEGQWGHYDLETDPVAETFLWNSPFIHPTVVFRRDILDAAKGYRVAPETERVEDYDLFMRLVAMGYAGHNIKDDLYEYRIDRNLKKYRPMATRINEACVRARGFKALGLGMKSFPYIAKPVVLGLIPGKLMGAIRRTRY